MILITGGASQGKLDYARRTFGGTVYTCTAADCDRAVSRKTLPAAAAGAEIIDDLEEFTRACVRRGIDPLDILRGCAGDLDGKVLICRDISAGLVPVDAELRAWREANGRTAIWLAGRAGTVIRLFCGLPLRLKDGNGSRTQE
ncbi:MAG: hypothetical protein ACOX41_07985 [Anaerovoracaceae bacterium]|jgi:adenosyl cobinamide kinase/adenosyl cobinamide phosphate guanylyltransferase